MRQKFVLNKKEWIYKWLPMCVCYGGMVYEIWTHRARVQENLWLLPDKKEPVIVMCKN